MTYAQDWYRKNREKHLQNCKKYYLEDKEGHKEKTKKWQKENRDAQRKIRMRTYYKNKEVENTRSRNYTLRRRIQVLKAYGGETPKCSNCSVTEIRVLELDHINNDGSQERKSVGKLGAGFYGYLIKNNYPNKDRYQILCKNCNYLKYLNAKQDSTGVYCANKACKRV